MWWNPQKAVHLVMFTEEIRNGELHFGAASEDNG